MTSLDLALARRLATSNLILPRWPAAVEKEFRTSLRLSHRYLRGIFFLVFALVFELGIDFGQSIFRPDPAVLPQLRTGIHTLVLLHLGVAWLVWLKPTRLTTLIAQYLAVALVTAGVLYLQYLGNRGQFSFPPIVTVAAVLPIILFCGYPAIPLAVGIVLTFGTSIYLEHHSDGVDAGTKIFGLLVVGLTLINAAVVFDFLSRRYWINWSLTALLGSTDSLTGLSTRAEFNRSIHQRLRQAYRDGKRISMLLLDIDHFKRINDGYGHVVGDQVLQAVGASLLSGLADRPSDMRVRYGGEEILLFWYDVSPEAAKSKAHRVLDLIRAIVVEVPPNLPPIELSASAGVIDLVPTQGEDPLALLKEVDALMYQAKRDGRDQLVLESR